MSRDSHRQLDRIRRRHTHAQRSRSLFALPLILAIAKSTLVQADLSSGSPSRPSVRVRQSPVMLVGHPAVPARLLGMAAFRSLSLPLPPSLSLSLSSLFGMISLFCAPSSTDAPPGSLARPTSACPSFEPSLPTRRRWLSLRRARARSRSKYALLQCYLSRPPFVFDCVSVPVSRRRRRPPPPPMSVRRLPRYLPELQEASQYTIAQYRLSQSQ